MKIIVECDIRNDDEVARALAIRDALREAWQVGGLPVLVQGHPAVVATCQ